MKIHQLPLQANKSNKRLGRGIGSGSGKTSGRGTKGQNARSGGGVAVGFEGGQTKLAQRLPKARGFKAFKPTYYQVINIEDLSKLKSTLIDREKLVQTGLARRPNRPIKLLAVGEIDRKVTIKVEAASKSAISKIEKAGGKVEIQPFLRSRLVSQRPPKEPSRGKRQESPAKTKNIRQGKV